MQECCSRISHLNLERLIVVLSYRKEPFPAAKTDNQETTYILRAYIISHFDLPFGYPAVIRYFSVPFSPLATKCLKMQKSRWCRGHQINY